MIDEACCTCATLLSVISPQYDEKTEKPTLQDRRLECCGRVICGNCIAVCTLDLSVPRASTDPLSKNNTRFASYCMYIFELGLPILNDFPSCKAYYGSRCLFGPLQILLLLRLLPRIRNADSEFSIGEPPIRKDAVQ